MIALIHKLTKTVMWVHESRAEAYMAAGHKPAAPTTAEEANEIISEDPQDQIPEDDQDVIIFDQDDEPEEKPAKKKNKK